MSERKFYKTTIQIVVLSEEPYDTTNLKQVYYDITDGDCSGSVDIISNEELTPKQAVAALGEQDSDPEFFGLDSDGNDFE